MVKHTQAIRRQIADELFERVWPSCEVGAKRVNVLRQVLYLNNPHTFYVWMIRETTSMFQWEMAQDLEIRRNSFNKWMRKDIKEHSFKEKPNSKKMNA